MGQPGQAYAGDIAYIHTQAGWLHWAVAVGPYSRQTVGGSMAKHMWAKWVDDALLLALGKRKPAKGLLWRPGRGSQYASDGHRALVKAFGMRQGMGRKGNCWGNAVAGSFFHALKTGLTHHGAYQTQPAAKQAAFEYIEAFYNRGRLHRPMGMRRQ